MVSWMGGIILWPPSLPPGFVLNLDARTSTNTTGTWYDSSGYGFNATEQGSGITYLSSGGINGLPSYYNHFTSDWYNVNCIDLGTVSSMTMFIVVQNIGSTGSGPSLMHLYNTGHAAPNVYLAPASGVAPAATNGIVVDDGAYSSGAYPAYNVGSAADHNAHIMAYTCDGSNDNLTVYVDGITPGTVVGKVDAGRFSDGMIDIAVFDNQGTELYIYMSHIIMWPRLLSSGEMKTTFDILANIWGVSL